MLEHAQLVLNLLSNACSMDTCLVDAGGEVQLETDYLSQGLTLRIKNDCIGLQDTQEKLASAFYTTKQDGLRLGLAICRDVIESHQGKLSLINALPKGCRTTVSLPYQ